MEKNATEYNHNLGLFFSRLDIKLLACGAISNPSMTYVYALLLKLLGSINFLSVRMAILKVQLEDIII